MRARQQVLADVEPASWHRYLHCRLILAALQPRACSQQPAACVPTYAYAIHRQLQAQKQDLEAAEFQALLAAGHNPYTVYKARAAQVRRGGARVGAVERGTWASRCRGRGACSRAGADCDQGRLLLRTVPGLADACYRPAVRRQPRTRQRPRCKRARRCGARGSRHSWRRSGGGASPHRSGRCAGPACGDETGRAAALDRACVVSSTPSRQLRLRAASARVRMGPQHYCCVRCIHPIRAALDCKPQG